eukprot:TRINITY_DN9129_c0_g3_i1.p1 TRINITY_DN9129_c0_g3~~TRINITY_DN9129_c0_g3_i1.p1  ORF type:complete len:826 (+),score=134.55 TRINITY_DN9129_c0_g3_i1:73-2550(+)
MINEDENIRTYSLEGCSCRIAGTGFSIVQSRWMLVHMCGRIFKIEIVPYMLWCLCWGVMFLIGWLAFHNADKNPFEPGNSMFDLFVLVSCSYVFGNALSAVIGLPPLFGFMIIGMVVRNIKSDPTLTDGISSNFTSVIKEVALTIIVGRAGLGLPVNTFLGDIRDIRKKVVVDGRIEWHQQGNCSRVLNSLKKLKTGLLLAVTPMAFEALSYAGMAVLIFKFSIIWGFLLGFVMAAVSPAVVVPGLIDLQTRGFVGGAGTPVPSIVMFASGLDDVFAITFFGIFFGMAFGGGAVTDKIVKAPLEILGGIVAGFLLGYILYRIAHRVIPKEYSAEGVSEYRQKTAQDNDMAVFGITHSVDPFGTSQNKMPADTRSHLLVFMLVFLSCVCMVVGFAGIDVGSAGALDSLGVLGAMATCFSVNYCFSQASFQLTSLHNDINLLTWCVESASQLDSDMSTRRFFKLRPGDSMITKIQENKKSIEDITAVTKLHATALAQLNMNFKIVWDLVACPLLFSLVGNSIDLGDLADPDLLWKAMLCITVSLTARCIGALLACTGSGWSMKNRIFVALAWMPKATVQAAVGGLALEEANKFKDKFCKTLANGVTQAPCQYDEDVEWGKIILQVSVLGVIFTAPLGAAAIAMLGPKWLEKVSDSEKADGSPREAVVVAADSHYRDAKRRLQSSIIAVGEMDHYSMVDYTRNIKQNPVPDINIDATATKLGERPEGRAKHRVKRSASFPASLAMSNPYRRGEHATLISATSCDDVQVVVSSPTSPVPSVPFNPLRTSIVAHLDPEPPIDVALETAASYSEPEVVSSHGEHSPSSLSP